MAPELIAFPQLAHTRPPSYADGDGACALEGGVGPHDVALELQPTESRAEPPEYREVPTTKAERLFWIGLFFPPAWIWGACYLVKATSPLKAARRKQYRSSRSLRRRNAAWEDRGPSVDLEAPGAEVAALWRVEELRWARRCLQALGILLLLLAAVGFVVLYSRTT